MQLQIYLEEMKISVLTVMQLCCANIARTVNCAVLLCKHDTNIDMWHNRAFYLSRSEEASDERVLQFREFSHFLRYQDGVFVI